MRNQFRGYYLPTQEQLAELWEEGVFVFDASVLLNLYRYTKETRDEFLRILKELQDRIWLPHQAALEFHRNRPAVILEQEEVYNQVSEVVGEISTKARKELKRVLQPDRHPLLDRAELLKLLEAGMKRLSGKVRERRQSHPELLDEDPIRSAIETQFEGKVGEAYDQKQIEKIKKQGQARYKNKIPPGYEDADKDEATRYGDLILWFQVIDYAKEQKNSLILVTDDRKEDWWWIPRGKTIAPRPELVAEMHARAKVLYYQYSPRDLMVNATKLLGYEIEDETIDEVERVAARSTTTYSVEDLAELKRRLAASNLGFPIETSPSLRAALEEFHGGLLKLTPTRVSQEASGSQDEQVEDEGARKDEEEQE